METWRVDKLERTPLPLRQCEPFKERTSLQAFSVKPLNYFPINWEMAKFDRILLVTPYDTPYYMYYTDTLDLPE